MKSLYFVLLISATTLSATYVWSPVGMKKPSEPIAEGRAMIYQPRVVQKQENAPKVEITLPGDPQDVTWSAQVRYAIHVSDEKDGDSKYGEIEARECLLEIAYFAVSEETEVREILGTSRKEQEHPGLSLLKRSTCFGCHGDKTRLAGPSFMEIAGRYEYNSRTAKDLGSRIIGGSSGIWGSQVMPSHPDFTMEDATRIADYILEQGGNKNRWVYPGLEGTFRIIKEPEDHDQGIYVLTASYTSSSNIRGEHSIILKIK